MNHPCSTAADSVILGLILDVRVSDLIEELAAPFAFRRLVGFRAEGFSLGTKIVP